MSRDGTRRSEDAASIRKAVMLPGFGDTRQESVPQTFLDAFSAETAHPSSSTAPPADTDTSSSGARGDGAAVLLPEEGSSENTGRHRARKRRSRRRPAFVAAAAVGAVLTAMPFLQQNGGSGRGESQGRPGPATTAPDTEGFPEPDETGGPIEPVAHTDVQVRGAEGTGNAGPSPSASSVRSGEEREAHGASARGRAPSGTPSGTPSGDAPRSTREPVASESQPELTGTVISGTHVFRAGQPTRAGAASLSMEPDGNFVVRDGSGVVRWAANTASLGDRAVFQSDGNLVVVATDGTTVWHSGTAGYPGAELVLQESGRLVIRAASGAVLWSTSGRG